MISRRLVVLLGLSQLVGWGVTYYLVALFGGPIAAETGWSLTAIHGGFSAALLAMGVTSPAIGRAVDRHGGRVVMGLGSVASACGCAWLASARDLGTYYAAWLVLGIAMRMTLYDAAFASLARIGGTAARRAIAGITLLGGLASTVLWPVGQALIDAFGWRGALLCYAGLALATLPLHLAIPAKRAGGATPTGEADAAPLARTARERALASGLFALTVTLVSALNSAMSAHMIALLGAFGFAAPAAVGIATLRGVGQSGARAAEVLFGARLHPLLLGALAAGLLLVAFGAGLAAAGSVAAAALFALLYGVGNGLLTITRGTQPLVLFDPAEYGTVAGRLVAPSFYLSALAPVLVALLVERFGHEAALAACLATALVTLGASVLLWRSFRPLRS